MDRAHEGILRRLRMDLRKSLAVDDHLLDHLYCKRIITEAEKLDIKAKESDGGGGGGRPVCGREQAEIILQLLPSRGRSAFAVFHDALQHSTLRSNHELAARLRSAEQKELGGKDVTCFAAPVEETASSRTRTGVAETGDSSSFDRSNSSGWASRPSSMDETDGSCSGMRHNPWHDDRFRKLMVWLVKSMEPAEARLVCFGEGLLSDTDMLELQGKEIQGSIRHNMLLMERLRIGGPASYDKFLAAVKEMGPQLAAKYDSLAELKHPAVTFR
eukprot:scpid75356/ scgid8870/ 